MKDFLNFIREQGVVGLAVGFILGGATSELVKAFVNDIVNPVLGILLGSVSGLKGASFTVAGAHLMWGDLISVFINFIVVAAVVYFGFKALKLDQLDKKK